MLDIVMIGPFPADPSVIKGGVQASVYGLSRALQKRSDIGGVEVFSIPVKADSTPLHRAKVEGIAVTYLNAPYRFLISVIIHMPLVFRTIRRNRNPVVHVHGTGLFQAALFVCMRIRNIPYVWTLHGITEKETHQSFRRQRTIGNLLRYFLYASLERFSLRFAPVIIVDTPYVSQAIAPPRNRLYVIPQGIFCEEFADLPRERSGPPLVLSLGVLSPRKGHHLTLEAFAQLKANLPSARLVIAGASPTPGYVPSLRNRIDELGLSESVEIVTDLPRNSILALLARSHVFALHSQEESQGIAFCEALAVGLPVVSTRVGGIPFVVEDRKDGFLVPYGDVQGFAAAISLLLTDASQHAEMSARARIASDRFNWTLIANDICSIYQAAMVTQGDMCNYIVDAEEREKVIVAFVRLGWHWHTDTHTLHHPNDTELMVHIDPLTLRVSYSAKLARQTHERVEIARYFRLPALPV